MASIQALTLLWAALGTPAGAPADDPLAPEEAVKRIRLPEGFQATLFAAEPDVVQPIAIAFDDRGRLWIVECLSYPGWLRSGEGRDRIVILEDRDGDGRHDARKVFWDRGTNLTGIELGFGGVWACAVPNLIFIPDRDLDDVPDGPPEVVLDGWDLEAKHNVVNGLVWGPDGWLYGQNGILSSSRVGAPGCPDSQRTPINCGVWRYHPIRRTFEVVAWGTTNPWGLDFDENGEMFISNCVIHHLWHVVPGAHFERMFGQDFDPHLYGLIPSGADHIHWGGGPWQSSRGGEGPHDEPGGGHAHTGAMVYLGDNWPDAYRGQIFLINIHGRRVNQDIPERRGSSFAIRHGKDFLSVEDPHFRGIALRYGPDGGVFLADWSDTGECHDYDEVRRATGRIYKITLGKSRPALADLASLGDPELVELLLHRNDWQVRHALRLILERSAAGKLDTSVRGRLFEILRTHPEASRRLRALWGMQAMAPLEESVVLEALESPLESQRAWALRLTLDDREPSPAINARLVAMASGDPSGLVRLHLASALQRLSSRGWGIAEGLAGREDDAGDPYLPLMLWYGVEPSCARSRERGVELLAAARIPLLRRHLARRLCSWSEGGFGISLPNSAQVTRIPGGLERIADLLASREDPAFQLDVLRGLHEGLEGRRAVPMPAAWPAALAKLATGPEASELARGLSITFGDPRALQALRDVVLDDRKDAAERERALQVLVQRRDPGLPPILRQLLAGKVLRGAAIRGLAAFSEEDTPRLLLGIYAALADGERQDVLATLASRPSYAMKLLDALAAGTIPRRDVSSFTVRQLLSLKDAGVEAKLNAVWGAARPQTAEKQALRKKYREMLAAESLGTANPSRGRRVFNRTCASCHRLFDSGRSVGPDLTGSQRANADYLLENLLEPSAVVARDYQMTVIQTKDGRVLSGVVSRDTDSSLTILTLNDALIVPRDDVEKLERTSSSMMPEDMLPSLPDAEVRDLFAYLASPGQVPPAEE